MENNKMETYQQKKRRLFGRFHSMTKYLEVLGHLLNVTKTKDDIWSIVKSDNFIEESKTFEWILLCKDILSFENKTQLLKILTKYIEDWDKPYAMFVSKSEDCGLVSISSLHDINWNFSFNDEPDGIICLERIDHKERIILDFDMEDNKELLEISIYKSLDESNF